MCYVYIIFVSSASCTVYGTPRVRVATTDAPVLPASKWKMASSPETKLGRCAVPTRPRKIKKKYIFLPTSFFFKQFFFFGALYFFYDIALFPVVSIPSRRRRSYRCFRCDIANANIGGEKKEEHRQEDNAVVTITIKLNKMPTPTGDA